MTPNKKRPAARRNPPKSSPRAKRSCSLIESSLRGSSPRLSKKNPSPPAFPATLKHAPSVLKINKDSDSVGAGSARSASSHIVFDPLMESTMTAANNGDVSSASKKIAARRATPFVRPAKRVVKTKKAQTLAALKEDDAK